MVIIRKENGHVEFTIYPGRNKFRFLWPFEWKCSSSDAMLPNREIMSA